MYIFTNTTVTGSVIICGFLLKLHLFYILVQVSILELMFSWSVNCSSNNVVLQSC